MHLFWKDKKQSEQKAIQPEFNGQIKNHLKKQFCQICNKQMSSKVAFGDGVKPCFTCQNCQLAAVGNSVQKLGSENLITTDKFSQVLTKQLMTYQTLSKTPTQQQKKSKDNADQLIAKVNDVSKNIRQQMKKLKQTSHNKMKELVSQSEKQNSILIFEEVEKIAKENKFNKLENGNLILKRSQVNCKGLTFTDEESINNANASINDRLTNLRKENKVKLAEVNQLINEINAIQF